MLRILLLGNTGQLGAELERLLNPLADVRGIDYPAIDLSDEKEARNRIREPAKGSHLFINAAAYTAVDRAEREPELAGAINAKAPGIMAEEAKRIGAAFIHYSTDYVFDGRKGKPYEETDTPNPLNVYGSTKLEGDRAVEGVGGAFFILRTAWVYSLKADRPSFAAKVLEWARRQDRLAIAADQVSNPTWARSLAEATVRLLRDAMVRGGTSSEVIDWIKEHAGIYHLAGGGYASRFDWAKAILELDPQKSEHRAREIVPAATDDFPAPAKRPLFSALDCAKFKRTFGFALPPWRTELARALGADSPRILPDS